MSIKYLMDYFRASLRKSKTAYSMSAMATQTVTISRLAGDLRGFLATLVALYELDDSMRQPCDRSAKTRMVILFYYFWQDRSHRVLQTFHPQIFVGRLTGADLVEQYKLLRQRGIKECKSKMASLLRSSHLSKHTNHF